ncbi:MAG TPA: (Fe-S)-binding protein [Candidatus Acidoferrales bacterium]|jgi:glycolate oxidase iron-sulfur subunit|nr:(Fe-S)-binding protein [Candidatus Acidoferrales bacterium]
MQASDAGARLQSELDKCMRCGMCMSVCPVYATEKNEAAVARGKIAIAEAVISGDLALDDPEVVDALFNCLVCKSCMQSCPSGVQFDRIILGLRAAIVEKNGLPWLKAAIFGALKQPAVLDGAMKVGAALQGLVFRDHPRFRAISPRSPFARLGKNAGFDGDRLFPAPATNPLRDRVPEVIPAAPDRAPQAPAPQAAQHASAPHASAPHASAPQASAPQVPAPQARAPQAPAPQAPAPQAKPRVAFFTGCSLNYFYPETGIDLIDVLTENQIEVVVPKDQQCCGTPVLVHGDVATARTLARNNIDAFEGTNAAYLVTGCGSCGSAWQHQFQELLGDDPVYGARAAYWAARTYDISTLLTDVIGYRFPKGRVEAVVTYHDSCHLKKSMKVAREPREILRAIPGVIFREMSKPDACCGSGGSYALTHFGTASEIARRKAADAAGTGASTVATGCPACMMQLLDSTHRFGSTQRVRHYISLLANSYRAERASKETSEKTNVAAL